MNSADALSNSSILFQYIASYLSFGYPLIFVGMIFEGDILFFTASFLTQQGVFNPLYMLPIAFAGAMAGDLLWFWGGYELEKLHISVSFIKRWMNHLAQPIDVHLVNRTRYTIFISKFAYGFNHLTLMRAGMLGIKLRESIKADLIATLAWMLVVGGLGWVSGASFGLIKHYLRYGEIALLIAIVIFFAFWHFVVTRRLEKEL